MTSYKKTYLSEEVQCDDSDSSDVDEKDSSDVDEKDSSNVDEKDSVTNDDNDETSPDELESAESGDSSDKDKKSGNQGWADSMAKILKAKAPKGKKTLVLSKAKKISDLKREKTLDVGFEVISDIKEEKPSIDKIPKSLLEEDEPVNKKRREDFPDFRKKPNILDKEREKTLSKIATRGVVQLFNAVRNQQKDIEKKIEEAGPLERKKDKIMKSLDKNQFLDKLMGQSKSEIVNKNKPAKLETKDEANDDKKPSTWNVFRDDFMMGAKMKDWDKKNNDADSDEEKMSSLSNSDSE